MGGRSHHCDVGATFVLLAGLLMRKKVSMSELRRITEKHVRLVLLLPVVINL